MSGSIAGSRASGGTDIWRATLSALCASFVGIGLARFAYTPLLPALVTHGWFSAGSAAYLGAANLAGYLVGVIGADRTARRIGAPAALRGAMLLATASLFACAWPGGFGWFFVWRLLSGMSGGIAMILAAPTVMPHVPPSRRGLVSGAIFMGVGIGIAASGTLVPLLLRQGLSQTWLGLGGLALLLSLIGWGGWPRPVLGSVSGSVSGSKAAHRPLQAHDLPLRRLRGVYLSYAFNAFGLVPHMVFLVAYVAQGLGQGLDTGTHHWVLFGLGAIVGPVLLGHVADRIGYQPALRLIFALEALFVALPIVSTTTVALILSSLVVGACTIGVVPLVLGRTHEILRHHPSAQPAAWRAATTSFAIFQAGGAYTLSFLFGLTGGDYRLLFGLGSAAMVLGLLVDLIVARSTAEPVTD